MNDTPESTQPRSEMYKGLTITPSYKSRAGSGRVCKTVQGYDVRPAAGVFWHGGTSTWMSSKNDAKNDISKWHYDAYHGDVEELSSTRTDYLQWLAKQWPDAPQPEKALQEKQIKQRAAELTAEKRELEPYWNRVADPEDWKRPIDSYVHKDDLEKTKAAIAFFTATEATATVLQPNWYRVAADGYRRGPAGDH